MREFCQLLPKDRLLTGNNPEFEDRTVLDRGKRVYIEDKTKARLTYDFSLVVLAHYVASLVSFRASSKLSNELHYG